MNSFKDQYPLVSIALASFNGEKFLRAQLDSLLDQTYPNIEIIISDDGSRDRTIEIVHEYILHHPHIRLVHNYGQKGIRENFTHALKYCHGRYIALCDQDDFWMPHKIEILVEKIGTASLIYHNSLLVDENGISLDRTVVTKKCGGRDPRVFLLKNVVSGHACLFKKELLGQALPFPPVKFHDWWLAVIAADQQGIRFFPEVLVHYRQHLNSATDFMVTKTGQDHDPLASYREELLWFKSFKRLRKFKSFFHEWHALHSRRSGQWFSLKLCITCLSNRNSLFYHFNKPEASVFFRCLQYAWGFRLKKIFNNRYASHIPHPLDGTGKKQDQRELIGVHSADSSF